MGRREVGMSAPSTIEWTDRTWNPVRGCTRVSAGCVNCYAECVAYRFSGPGLPYEGLATKVNGHAAWTGQIRYVTEDVALPLRWRKPSRIFVNSMSDLFHDGVTDQQLVELFAVMANSLQYTFQVLTKRPERMRAFLGRLRWAVGLGVVDVYGYRTMFARLPYLDDPRGYWEPIRHGPPDQGIKTIDGFIAPNIWLGVSVEDQATADARIPLLLDTPAAIRFVSYEPALGSVDVRRWMRCFTAARTGGSIGPVAITERAGVDWVIVGGESGPRARPFDIAWARSMKDQIACSMGGTKLFVKQLGANPMQSCPGCGRGVGFVPGGMVDACSATHRALIAEMRPIRNSKGGDPAEWPEDLRVREFPPQVSA